MAAPTRADPTGHHTDALLADDDADYPPVRNSGYSVMPPSTYRVAPLT